MLLERLDDHDGAGWNRLENIIYQAAVAGGFVVTSCYERGSIFFEGEDHSEIADHQAIKSIIETLEYFFQDFGATFHCETSYFVGEFEKLRSEHTSGARKLAINETIQHLEQKTHRLTKHYEDFVRGFDDNRISVLLDPNDNENSLKDGLPLCCSAIAFVIGNRPRVGAIYEPNSRRVYVATLRGNSSSAKIISDTDFTVSHDLPKERTKRLSIRGKEQSLQIVTQITRSNLARRKDLLARIQRMPPETSVYMFNGGHFSMVQVARGGLDCYLNNWAYTSDVAPGEVLVRAVGGKVTEVDYRSENPRVDVIAAGSEEIFERVAGS